VETTNERLTFAEAFDLDLRRSGLEQRDVCKQLTEQNEPQITSAAISNWKRRGTLPPHRLKRLVEIFGAGSALAEYLAAAKEDPPPRVMTRARIFAYDSKRPVLSANVKIEPSSQSLARVRTADAQAFYERLSPEQREHASAGIRIAGVAYRFDYLTENCAVAFRICQNPREVMSPLMRAAVRLLLVKALDDPDAPVKRRLVMVILATYDMLDDPVFRQVTIELSTLGIEVHNIMSLDVVPDVVDALDRPKTAIEDDFDPM
jgi:hypothetical protein